MDPENMQNRHLRGDLRCTATISDSIKHYVILYLREENVSLTKRHWSVKNLNKMQDLNEKD